MFQTKIAEKTKTHFFYSISVSENRAVYEIMWKNILLPDRPQITIWRQTRCILDNRGYKHNPRICNTYCFSTAQMLHKCTSILHDKYNCLFGREIISDLTLMYVED